MSVLEQTDSPLQVGALVLAGILAGGLVAFFVDGVPQYAIPALGLVVIAIAEYVKRRE